MLTLWPARKRKRQKRKRESYIFLSQASERQDQLNLLKDCEDCSEFRLKKKKNHTPKIIVLRVGTLRYMGQNSQQWDKSYKRDPWKLVYPSSMEGYSYKLPCVRKKTLPGKNLDNLISLSSV